MRESNFIFDSVQLLYCKCHKINFKYGVSYTDLIKKKKATINSKNLDDKFFQYAVIVALNYEENESHPQRVSNIKPFIKLERNELSIKNR